MGNSRTETVNGQDITIFEGSREDLQDFLGMAQEIESLGEEDQKKRIEEIFGEQKEQEEGEEKEEEEDLPAEVQQRKDEIESRQSSRANTDVALAMQIADQVAADSMPDSPCYVVHGAKALCSQGSREARLVVPLDHGVILNKRPQLTAEDKASLINVMCFGNCFSVDNPKMAQAAIDATNAYNQRKAQGFWGKVKSFFGIKPKEVTSVSKELQQLCICECEPCITEDSFWEEGNDRSQIMKKKTLLQTATLVCKYGGVIRITNNGQNEAGGQNG